MFKSGNKKTNKKLLTKTKTYQKSHQSPNKILNHKHNTTQVTAAVFDNLFKKKKKILNLQIKKKLFHNREGAVKK